MASSRIREIEQQLNDVQNALSAMSSQSSGLATELSRNSLLARKSELEQQLSLSKRARGREIMEFRLMGRMVDGGSIPLYMLSRFSQHVGGFLLSGFAKVKTGKEPKGPIPISIVNEANIRLAGLSKGSTKLTVVGDSNADLFGFSLLEDVFSRGFEILRNDDENAATESVAVLGKRSVRHLANALQDLQQADLEMNIEWEKPEGTQLVWAGNFNAISDAKSRLNAMELLPSIQQEYIGTITLLSRSGRIELKLDSGEIVKIYYPQNLLNVVSQLHLGQVVSLRASEVIARNILTGAEKGSNELLGLNWIR